MGAGSKAFNPASTSLRIIVRFLNADGTPHMFPEQPGHLQTFKNAIEPLLTKLGVQGTWQRFFNTGPNGEVTGGAIRIDGVPTKDGLLVEVDTVKAKDINCHVDGWLFSTQEVVKIVPQTDGTTKTTRVKTGTKAVVVKKGNRGPGPTQSDAPGEWGDSWDCDEVGTCCPKDAVKTLGGDLAGFRIPGSPGGY